jgi:hypothetical protein
MLPASFQIPAAVILLIGGVIACFAGYRFFRIVLGIFGFLIGALVASAATGTEHTAWMIGAALVGGVIGALILIAAYFVGVALIGALIGALATSLIWASLGREPGTWIVIAFAIAGALTALALQRYVIVGFTAFGGAWTVIVGALALTVDHTTIDKAARNNVWLAYPMNPAPGRYWVFFVLLALGIAGAFVQLSITAKGKK